MERKEHKVGERFKDGNTLLETRKGDCPECFYSNNGCDNEDVHGPCCSQDRTDETDVFFKEIKEMKEENKKQFYIWGVKDRGYDVLKVLFENNNMKNCINDFISSYFGQEDSLYIVNKYHGVRTFEKNIDDDIINLITSNWTELKLPWKPKDKELVWAWDDGDNCSKLLNFYDANNNCLFCSNGKRDGYEYNHYAPFEGEFPQWAKDALNKLED